jgi:TPR repeat protein
VQKLPILTIVRDFDAQNAEFNNALRAHDIAIPLNIYKFNPRAVVSNPLVLDTLFEMQNVDLLKWLVLTQAVAMANLGDIKLKADVVRQIVEHVDGMEVSFDTRWGFSDRNEDIEALFKRANFMATISKAAMDLIQDRGDVHMKEDVAATVKSTLYLMKACNRRARDKFFDYGLTRDIPVRYVVVDRLAHRLYEALTEGHPKKRAALVHSLKENMLSPSLRESYRFWRRDKVWPTGTDLFLRLKLMYDHAFIENLLTGDWINWVYLGYAFSAEQDNVTADLCLDMAASLGQEVACCEIAYHYQKGNNLPKDLEKAIEYSRMALDFAPIDAVAQFRHGSILCSTGDHTSAVPYFKLAADQGSVCGEIEYARCFEFGMGVPSDLIVAAKYYKRASDHGSAVGQNQYALCLYFSKGLSQDLPEAAKYFKMAADQGHIMGQYNYATCLRDGEGVLQDLQEAVKYYKMSADQGYAPAQVDYGLCFDFMSECTLCDEMERVKYVKMAADQRYARGLYCYGVCLRDGIGIKENKAEAERYFRMAAELGYSPSSE